MDFFNEYLTSINQSTATIKASDFESNTTKLRPFPFNSQPKAFQMFDSMMIAHLSFELEMIHMFVLALLQNLFHRELLVLTGVMKEFVNFESKHQIAVHFLVNFCQ
jgi:hypothetical protein